MGFLLMNRLENWNLKIDLHVKSLPIIHLKNLLVGQLYPVRGSYCQVSQ